MRIINRALVQKVSGISPIWIVPVVALGIALWLAVQARLEHGANVVIEFESATDIKPGQTQIKLNDVKVGTVKDVKLTSDLKSVRVYAEIDREVSSHLSVNTRFWVVTPRISASGVSNLNTLISGVHIVMDPGESGRYATEFKGLSESPLFQSDEPGTSYVLQAEELGSLDIASPIYYRQIRVGEVTGYKLSESREQVDINIFVRAPYDELVQTRSRFWNVSGFGFSIDAEGMKARMASLTSLISGGIAFDNAVGFENATLAESGAKFYLYLDRESVLEGRFDVKHYYRLQFSGSVRGLTLGAPVEFRGIRVGEVVDVVLESADNLDDVLQVYIALEPQRLEHNENPSRENVDARMEDLVNQGLRAQMRTASLLTGSKFIDLVFSGESEAKFIRSENYSEIPTISDPSEALTQQASEVMDKISKIPFDDIGNNLSTSLASLNTILSTLEKKNTAGKIDDAFGNLEETLASANDALKQLNTTMQSMDHAISPDSELKYELTEMLKAVGDAANSVQLFVDELNRHPNALISGAKKDD